MSRKDSGDVGESANSRGMPSSEGAKLAKLRLEPVRLAASTGFAPHELTRVRTLVAEHRDMLLEAWHEFFRS